MRTALILIATTFALAACFGGSDEPAAPSSSTLPSLGVTSPTPASPTRPNAAPVIVPTTPPAATVTGSRIQIADVSGSVGQVVSVAASIYDVKSGIAGYALVVSLADPSVGRITGVSMPDFGLTIIGDLPAGSVDITAVDLPGLLEGEIKEATLATLAIELLGPGTTDILLEVLSVDDDDGNVVTPRLVSGRITAN